MLNGRLVVGSAQLNLICGGLRDAGVHRASSTLWVLLVAPPGGAVSPSSGFGPSDVRITADTMGFACYDYTSATVTFTAAGALDPRVVTVNVQVGQPELHAGAAAGATPKR